jgi:hypothetical protein
MCLMYFLDSHLHLFQLSLEIGSCLCRSEKKLIKCSTQVFCLTSCNVLLVIDVNPVNSLTKLKSVHRCFRLSCFLSKLLCPTNHNLHDLIYYQCINFLCMVLKVAIFQRVSIWKLYMHLSSNYEVHQGSMKFSKNLAAVTWSKFYTEVPQILGTNIQNLSPQQPDTQDLCLPVYVLTIAII